MPRLKGLKIPYWILVRKTSIGEVYRTWVSESYIKRKAILYTSYASAENSRDAILNATNIEWQIKKLK